MKVIKLGHRYELSNFERPELPGQTIQFIEKLPVPSANKEDPTPTLETINDGTTNEEVLAVLIDRLKFLNEKFPCKENAVAITHIETGLLWLEKRTAERKARGVEGKHLK